MHISPLNADYLATKASRGRTTWKSASRGIRWRPAITWHQHGFYAAEATCFYDHRYSPAQAAAVTDLVKQDADIDDWLATGLPAERVIAYLRAGVTLDEYDEFEASEDASDEALTMLAGFLQAP